MLLFPRWLFLFYLFIWCGRTLLLLVNFLLVKGPLNIMIQWIIIVTRKPMSGIKGTINSFCIKFLALVSFPVFVNDTFMFQYFRQEIKQKRTFDVNKNIFIPKPEPILSKKKKAIFPLGAPVSVPLSKELACPSRAPPDRTVHRLTGFSSRPHILLSKTNCHKRRLTRMSA